jgi:N,N'-diacetyllegionaminate synthase
MKSNSTLIIAEAGVNHNGSLSLARDLVQIAAEAGADLIKFQTFAADRLVTSSTAKADYQLETTEAQESQHEMIRKLELSREVHEELMEYCQQCGIGFFSTGFDIQSVDLLAELGLDCFKIPSGEITNLPHLRHIGSYGRPIILSTGMAKLGEIEAALEALEASGTPREKVTVLHCNTEYPTPMKDVNLRAMCAIRDALGVKVGYSDHTLGIEVSVAAVALGATMIEKHFTMDRTLPGPDHRASLEPAELKAMVRAIRNIELALSGDGLKRPSQSESKNILIVRKSLVAARTIQVGEAFTTENLTIKRPGSGVSPMRWDEFLGRTAIRSYVEDELIER